jgi:hypothetical protein
LCTVSFIGPEVLCLYTAIRFKVFSLASNGSLGKNMEKLRSDKYQLIIAYSFHDSFNSDKNKNWEKE